MPDTASAPSTDSTPPVLRPAEVAERLGISAATLRRWSSRFSEFLELKDGSQDGGSHRRYTVGDVATLGRVQELLEQGWTYEQVADRLARDPEGETIEQPPSEAVVEGGAVAEPGPAADTAMVSVNAIFDADTELAADDLPPAARFLRDTMQTVTRSQQLILNSQQASRDMLGVMIQDNLNLKGENTTLRERMLELERELAELQRHYADTRERMEIRMRVLEDAIAKLMASQPTPAARTSQPSGPRPAPATPSPYSQPAAAPPTAQPAYASAPPAYTPSPYALQPQAAPSYPPQGYGSQPAPSYPAQGYQTQPSAPASYPAPYPDQQAPPPKRGFWARLLGG